MRTGPEFVKNETEIMRTVLDQFGADLRVSVPGIIQSFDAGKQTVTVQIALREKISIKGVNSWRAIPILVDVPIFMPRAGDYVLTMPITVGDECLVIFGDACMDAWYQSGGVQNQMDKRRHDLSDGFALCGIWSQPRVVSGYSTDSAQLRNLEGTAFVEIKGDVINVIGSNINCTATESISLKAGEKISLTTPLLEFNVAAITSPGAAGVGIGTVDLKAANIKINSEGNTSIDDRNFMQHTHMEPGESSGTGGVE